MATGKAQQLTNGALTLTVNVSEGSYELRAGAKEPVFRARVGAQIEHQWVRSTDYPKRNSAESVFHDALGAGRQIAVSCSALRDRPDLIYVLQVYDRLPYATVQVELRNNLPGTVTVQAIRNIETTSQPAVDLGGPGTSDRVLSDGWSSGASFSDMAYGRAARGVGSQLIFNRASGRSLFLGALTAGRFVTLLNLVSRGAAIDSYTVDSTGTTELQRGDRHIPAESLVELSLPLESGKKMTSERLLMAAGPDYDGLLTAYGDAIRRLHQARVSAPNLLGWWSWTSYYKQINDAAAVANAQWLATNLKPLGYTYFHLDDGYENARGEYTTPHPGRFPRGVRPLGEEVRRLGLTFGIWTAPFEVSDGAWVYQQHKDWLVHGADGQPLPIDTNAKGAGSLFVLDTTHPEAQEYLRQTYSVLVKEWGARYIKLDFMDRTSIEGYRHRPNTTAFEALRIGLETIRKAVGDDMLLDKDGSPVLPAVGLVDTGRISEDTAHNYQKTRSAARAIAARFYMNRNFFINDPDAFNICQHVPNPVGDNRPTTRAQALTLEEAQVSIVLSAVSGGMYEIGDDLPMLGAEEDRLELVKNRDLLQMAKLSRASVPIDLMTYGPEDGQPSVFFLREDERQSILTVFNWTDRLRSRVVQLASLGVAAGHTVQACDVLSQCKPLPIADGAVQLENQPAHSVKVVKLIDTTIRAAQKGR
jgi:hypothetical protein